MKKIEKLEFAKDLLYEILSANLRIVGNEAGSPAFIEDTRKTSHIGLYASAALLEILGRENTHGAPFYELFVNTFGSRIGLDGNIQDTKVIRDANNLFKLCAVLLALKNVAPDKKSDKLIRCHNYVIERVLFLMSPTGYWEYSKFAENPSAPEYVLPTSLALIALYGAPVGSDVLIKPRRYLENWLRRILEGHPNAAATLVPEIAVCAYALEITNSISTTRLTSYHRSHIVLLLYESFISDQSYREHTVRVFSVVNNEYQSSTYTFLIDYYVIAYFVLTRSMCLKSSLMNRKLLSLADTIINSGKFVSSIDGQSFTKTNVVAFQLFELILENIPFFGNSTILSLYLETRKKPIHSDYRRRARYVVGTFVVISISLFYFIVVASNVTQKWEFIASATSGIIAALLYHWMSE